MIKNDIIKSVLLIVVSISAIFVIFFYNNLLGTEIYINKSVDIGYRSFINYIESLKFDINKASLEDLCLIDGIGEVTAGKIIQKREELGYFSNFYEIDEIDGIGEKTLKDIMEVYKIK